MSISAKFCRRVHELRVECHGPPFRIAVQPVTGILNISVLPRLPT